ncbi:MAG: hypothetical protein ACRD0U_08640, partial [Acidimicrobiales bacterium]
AAGSAPGPTVTSGTAISVVIPVSNGGQSTITDLQGTSTIGTLTCALTTLTPGQQTTCTVNGTAANGTQVILVVLAGVSSGEPITSIANVHYTGQSSAGTPGGTGGTGTGTGTGTGPGTGTGTGAGAGTGTDSGARLPSSVPAGDGLPSTGTTPLPLLLMVLGLALAGLMMTGIAVRRLPG